MTDLAKLVVKLEAQTGQYQAQLERAQRQLSRFESIGSKALGAIGGVVAGISFVHLIKGSIDAADRMNDLAKQTGIGVEALSALKFAAEQSGTDLDSLTTGLRFLGKQAVEAASGNKEAAESFASIGVEVRNAQGQIKPLEQLLSEVAEGFSQYADGAAKSALSQKLLSRSGAELIPFLNEGADGIQELTDRARELGAVISTETALAADEFNDNLNALKASASGLVTQAIGPLLPVLNDLLESFEDTGDGATDLSVPTKALAFAFKFLADGAASTVHTFRVVGRDIGALSAAYVTGVDTAIRAAQRLKALDFKGAQEVLAEGRRAGAAIMSEADADMEAEAVRFQNQLDRIWAAGTDDILEEIKIRAKKIKKELGAGGAGAADALTEFSIAKPDPLATRFWEKYYEDINELTKTSEEQQISSFYRIQAGLDDLLANGQISAEKYAERRNAAIDSVLPEFDEDLKDLKSKVVAATDELNEYQKEAQRNTVDIIAETIEASFTGGLDEIPKLFQNMLLKLIIQAQAAQLGKYLFGEGGSGGSGFAGSLGGIITKLFSGGRARGGSVVPGKIYRVNEDTPNSEWFSPASAGNITPATAGGMMVTNHFHISTPDGRIGIQTQQQLAAAAARGISNGTRRGN